VGAGVINGVLLMENIGEISHVNLYDSTQSKTRRTQNNILKQPPSHKNHATSPQTTTSHHKVTERCDSHKPHNHMGRDPWRDNSTTLGL
jgi:hypothetical protein